jgi:hypothetical protein
MQVLPRLKLPNCFLGRNRSFRSRNLGSGGWTSSNLYTWAESTKSPFPSFSETERDAESISGSRLSFFTYFLITVFFYVLPSYFWVVLVCLFVLIVFS